MSAQVRDTDIILEEWKVATENARHFNDLLMRLRTLGLPMVITIIGAGAALMGTGLTLKLNRGIIDLVGTIVALLVVAFFVKSMSREEWSTKHDFPVPLYGWERIAWLSVTVVLFVLFSAALIYDTCFGEGFNTSKEYSVGTFVILAGLALLAALYVMDRFYYYKLLIGAVRRAKELEDQNGLSYHLTERIGQSITQNEATRLITLFYWIPGFCALSGSLAWLLFV